MSNETSFKDIVTNIKRNTGLQKKQIAKKIGITAYYLWKLEIGKAQPSKKVLQSVDKVFGEHGQKLIKYECHVKLTMLEAEMIGKYRKSPLNRKKAILLFMDMVGRENNE